MSAQRNHLDFFAISIMLMLCTIWGLSAGGAQAGGR